MARLTIGRLFFLNSGGSVLVPPVEGSDGSGAEVLINPADLLLEPIALSAQYTLSLTLSEADLVVQPMDLELEMDVNLVGQADGTSAATGLLAWTLAFSGQADGTSTAVASLSAMVSLSGLAGGNATATGILSTLVGLTGTAAGSSSTSGDLSVIESANITGTAAGTSSASGALKVLISLSGEGDGEASASGDLGVLMSMTGTAAGTSTASGELTAIEPSDFVTTVTDAAPVHWWKFEATPYTGTITDYGSAEVDLSGLTAESGTTLGSTGTPIPAVSIGDYAPFVSQFVGSAPTGATYWATTEAAVEDFAIDISGDWTFAYFHKFSNYGTTGDEAVMQFLLSYYDTSEDEYSGLYFSRDGVAGDDYEDIAYMSYYGTDFEDQLRAFYVREPVGWDRDEWALIVWRWDASMGVMRGSVFSVGFEEQKSPTPIESWGGEIAAPTDITPDDWDLIIGCYNGAETKIGSYFSNYIWFDECLEDETVTDLAVDGLGWYPMEVPAIGIIDAVLSTEYFGTSAWESEYPLEVQAGDLLLLAVAATTYSVSSVDDWEEIDAPFGTSVELSIYARVATGAETGTISITGGGAAWVTTQVVRIPAGKWQPDELANSVKVGTGVSGFGQTNPPSVSNTWTDYGIPGLAWAMVANSDDASSLSSVTAPTDFFNLRWDSSTGGSNTLYSAEGEALMNGATDPDAFGQSPSDTNATNLVLVRPAIPYPREYSKALELTECLHSRYQMDEASGNITDSVGSLVGVVTGTATYEEEQNLLTDGSTGITIDGSQYWLLGSVGDYDFLTQAEFTIAMWVTLDVASGLRFTLVGQSASTAVDGVYLAMDNRSSVGYSFRFINYGDGSSQECRASIRDTTDYGQGFFLTAVSSTSGMKIYVNGRDVTNPSYAPNAVAKTASGTNQPYLGADASAANEFRGQLDDVAFFDEALDADQVAMLWHAGRYKHLHDELAEESGTLMFLSGKNGTLEDLAGTVTDGDWATKPKVANGKIRSTGWTTGNSVTDLEETGDIVLRTKFTIGDEAPASGDHIIATNGYGTDVSVRNSFWGIYWASSSTITYAHESGAGTNRSATFSLPTTIFSGEEIYISVRRVSNIVQMWCRQGGGSDFTQMTLSSVSGGTNNGNDTATLTAPDGGGDVSLTVMCFDEGGNDYVGEFEFAQLVGATTTDELENLVAGKVQLGQYKG